MAPFLLDSSWRRKAASAVACLGLVCCQVGAGLLLAHVARAAGAAPAAPQAPADFAALVSQLVLQADSESRGLQPLEEQALAVLDRAALAGLNATTPDLDDLNAKLAQMVTRQPALGESYRVVKLGGRPTAYGLVANFGVAGPAAIRVYSGPAGNLALAGRVDRFSQRGFLDNFVELIPWNGADPSGLFLTVSGRTDQLQTGVFGAWRFDGHGVFPLWFSDILAQSAYELGADGFRITYCGEPDVNDETKCLHAVRDRYGWSNGFWRLLQSDDLPGTSSTSGTPGAPGTSQ